MKTRQVSGVGVVAVAPGASTSAADGVKETASAPKQQRGAAADAAQAGPTKAPLGTAAVASQRVSGATSPALGRASADSYVTYYLFSTDKEARFDALPRDLSQKLEKLAKRHGKDFMQLQAAEIGSDFFASDMVLKVKASLASKLTKLVETNAKVGMLTLPELLAAQPSGKPIGDATIAALESKGAAAELGAVLDLHAGLTQSAGQLTEEQKKKIAFGVSSALGTITKLFNSVLLEESRPRRQEIIAANKEKPKSIGDHFGGYLNASSQAIAEVRAKGGTPELSALASLLVKAAEVLDTLRTPLSLGLLDRILAQADGMILGHVAAHPATAQRLLDALSFQLDQNQAQTAKFYATEPDQRKGMRMSSSSGGLEFLSSRRYEYTGAGTWSESYPFSETSLNALLLLGTPAAAGASGLIRDFLTKADALMPKLIEAHKQNYLQEELGRTGGLAETNDPEQKRFQDSMLRHALERYPDRKITGTPATQRVIGGLGYSLLAESEHYSRKQAFSEKAKLVVEMLGTLKSPELREELVDTGIGLYVLFTQDAAFKKDADVQKLVGALISSLVAADIPEPIRSIAAITLAGRGAIELIPMVLGALKSANDDVYRLAMNTLMAFATVARGSLEGITNKAAFKDMTVAERAALGQALVAALPSLGDIVVNTKGVWGRITAAELIATLGAKHDASVQYLRDMFAPDITTVYFSDKYPGSKNVTVRVHAAKALGAFGKLAADALPELEQATAFGLEAKKVAEFIDARRKAHAEAKQSGNYTVQNDPEARKLVEPMLAKVAVANSGAERALAFLADPKGVDLSKVASYELDRHPSPEGAIFEIVQVGEAAAAAAVKVKGSAAA